MSVQINQHTHTPSVSMPNVFVYQRTRYRQYISATFRFVESQHRIEHKTRMALIRRGKENSTKAHQKHFDMRNTGSRRLGGTCARRSKSSPVGSHAVGAHRPGQSNTILTPPMDLQKRWLYFGLPFEPAPKRVPKKNTLQVTDSA